jgi:hypothetical protein
MRTILYQINLCISKWSHIPLLICQIKENRLIILREIKLCISIFNSEISWPQIYEVEFENFRRYMNVKPITVVARSKARTIFARSNTGIVCSNPPRDMDICVRLFCLCCSMCR